MTKSGQQLETRTFLLPLTLDGGDEPVFCLLSQNQIVEILGKRRIRRIPFCPPYLKGIVPYQDGLLPVIDLNLVWGHESSSGDKAPKQLVVVRTGSTDPRTGERLKIAVAADTGVRMIKLPLQAFEDAFVAQEAPEALRACGILRGFFRRQEQGIALVDLDRLAQGAESLGQGEADC